VEEEVTVTAGPKPKKRQGTKRSATASALINFIPNDPLAVDELPMRQVAPRPDRPAGRAGITLDGAAAEAVYPPDDERFVQWQARQAAVLAVEAWEEVLGSPITSWAKESANPTSLQVRPDQGEDMNAYYDRKGVSFFHKFRDGATDYSGASTDVVSHEVGHAILDGIRPDLWDLDFREAGAFHEAFGDVTALITALSDRETREKLLKITPDLGQSNFVEASAEDLSDTIRRVLGPTHPAAKPRHALNSFKWQLPETMPSWGGPDDMIDEVHSIARIMSGCFYDLLRLIFAKSGSSRQDQLWSATCTAGKLFHEAATTAPALPRFFRSVGRAMVLADQTLNSGANRALIGQAFNGHGLALGAQSFLAPEIALAGAPPVMDRRRGAVTLEPATLRDLRRRVGAPAHAMANVDLMQLGDTPVANVAIRHEVSLDTVDKRLQGVVAPVHTVALVGESGGSAALLLAARPGVPTDEVLGFVQSLVNHDQVAFDAQQPKRRGAAATRPRAGGPTHAIRSRGGKKELYRVRFAFADPHASRG
jgi:Fungalysin metallopeptidase (M36)